MGRKAKHRSGRRSPGGATAAPAVAALPSRTSSVAYRDERPTGRALQSYLERTAPEVVSATYWFEPLPDPPLQAVTIRFSGRRIGPTGRPKPGDRFVHDETVDGIAAGCGPVAVTATVHNVNPGDWTVEARILSCTAAEPEPAGNGRARRQPLAPTYPARWSWRRWRPTPAPATPVATSLAPFARRPGIVPGSWALLAAAGIALALIVQTLLISTADLHLGHVLSVSLLSLLAGAIGAKAWFLALHRNERRREGWCVQGLLAGVILAAPPLLTLLHVPAGGFLDATAPGLMFGLAIGRVGCFFTGCCTGRPSGSRWAIWSSDRRVGARRLPAQLLESALALTIGMLTLAAFLTIGPHHGNLFVAALAAYTLIRQALLRLRQEPRRSRHGLRAVTVTAAAVLIADLALLALI